MVLASRDDWDAYSGRTSGPDNRAPERRFGEHRVSSRSTLSMSQPLHGDAVSVPPLRERVETQPYWFMKMDLGDGVLTPGWSDPEHDKLPWFGLPEDLTGQRVLDVGCAKGFFSFEAERRGAAEVVSLDFDPECVKRFDICAQALGSANRACVMSVYDLDPMELGTFDLVMFFGLLYHLPDPLGGMDKVDAMASGTVLIQSWTIETAAMRDIPLARFRPHGLMSGPKDNPTFDPTVFWEPNAACIAALLDHVGMVEVERLPGPPESTREHLVRRLRPRKYAQWNSNATSGRVWPRLQPNEGQDVLVGRISAKMPDQWNAPTCQFGRVTGVVPMRTCRHSEALVPPFARASWRGTSQLQLHLRQQRPHGHRRCRGGPLRVESVLGVHGE